MVRQYDPSPVTQPPLLDELRGVVGDAHLLVDDDLKASYETDWMRRWSGRSTCVVRPADRGEVAAVVTACASRRVSIVPQGGNTGLVGGSVPGTGEPVIVSLRRLTGISEVSAAGRVTVGAGCTLEEVQTAVAGSGWDVGVDLASRASATIGGMIATNAGGIRVLRDGMMRRQVVGIEVVLASGQVVSSMRGLVKDNTGYDLAGLLCGSEGTLGIVTQAILQLVPSRPYRVVALVPVSGIAEAVGVVNAVRNSLPSLESAEYVSAETVALVRRHGNLPAPSSTGDSAVLLFECAGVADPTDELFAAVGGFDEAVVGMDSAARRRLWAYRETATESIAGRGIPHKLDITVPLGRMAAFEAALLETVVGPDHETYLFGHIADEGLHVNVISTDPTDHALDEAIMRLAAEHGGSISAEHGIGRAKISGLDLMRSATELATMKAIRTALDPDRILNPGVLFPAEV